ncbi:hypothetical protein MVEN_00064100 [Mycena venus]|uniref:Uncharacterized protein n=1 Tax=Mycena venus TaxID=2733690 RepID=A0A8H7DH52_9AGAR|nr:hypothetical protein MVEN_00064100 [Mycena venus]
MGQTGAGIETEDDIQPGTSLTTKWDQIKTDFPWFFHVRSLIGERPNLMPTGLGNNDSEVELSLLLASDRDGDDTSSLVRDDTPASPRSPSAELSEPIDVDDSDSDIPLAPTLASAQRKRKKSESADAEITDVKPEMKKTKPAPGVSQPAPKKTTARPATTKDKFAAIAVAEEETAQQELKVKRAKLSARKEIELEKVRAQGKVKVEKERAKRDIAELKLKQEHEYRMARMRLEAGMGQCRAGPGTYASGSQARFDSVPFFSDSDFGAADSQAFDFDSSASTSFDMSIEFPYGSSDA